MSYMVTEPALHRPGNTHTGHASTRVPLSPEELRQGSLPLAHWCRTGTVGVGGCWQPPAVAPVSRRPGLHLLWETDSREHHTKAQCTCFHAGSAPSCKVLAFLKHRTEYIRISNVRDRKKDTNKGVQNHGLGVVM